MSEKKKYPDIIDKKYYETINQVFKKYKVDNKNKLTLKQICFPDKFQHQLPQQFVANYINPLTPYKGLLVYHSIGSGKTCSAVNIAEQWKDKRHIIVVVPASLKGNFRNELRSSCAGNAYMSMKDRNEIKKYHPTSKEYKSIIETSDNKIDKYYTIL
jgi:hypothetical protein